MDPIFLDQYDDLIRIIITAPILYVSIVLMIRLSGKRSTSQMNNFDWIVTVAIGSLASSGIVLEDITALESIAGIGALLLLQWLLTKGVLYSRTLSRLVKANPVTLLRAGQFNEKAMRSERVTKREILAALREHGLIDPADAELVILESDASLSVIPKLDNQSKLHAAAYIDGLGEIPAAKRAEPS